MVRVLAASECSEGLSAIMQSVYDMEKQVYADAFFTWALKKQNGMNPGEPPDWLRLEMHPADARRIRMRVLGLIAKKLGV